MLIYIVAGAAGGGALIVCVVVILVTICCCVSCSRRKKKSDTLLSVNTIFYLLDYTVLTLCVLYVQEEQFVRERSSFIWLEVSIATITMILENLIGAIGTLWFALKETASFNSPKYCHIMWELHLLFPPVNLQETTSSSTDARGGRSQRR